MSPKGVQRAETPTTVEVEVVGEEARVHRLLRCGHILGSLLREILEEIYLSQRCSPPLTRTQFCLLKLITVNADVQPSVIARYLGVSPAAITKTVDKLENLGLVNRDPCIEDRRATLLSATDDGFRVVGEYEELKASRITPVVEELEPNELDDLCDLLETLCVDLLRHGQPTQEGCMRCAGYYSDDCLVGLEQGGCTLRPNSKMTEKNLA